MLNYHCMYSFVDILVVLSYNPIITFLGGLKAVKGKFFVIILSLVLTIFLAGCQCEHSWQEPNCTTPKICELCGESNGSALGHTWVAATCSSPKTCSNCNTTEGEALGHKWNDATCTKPMACSVCAEIAGDPLGHDWTDATCTTPSSCRICSTTSGSALGHKVSSWKIAVVSTCSDAGYQEGTCDICNEPQKESLPLAEHSESDWRIKTEPTETKSGTRVKVCTVCEKELKTEQFTLSPEEIKARYKAKCKRIAYNELARTPDKYEDEYVVFTGYVVQVCSEASSPLYYSTYRVATMGRYDNVVLIYVDNYGSGRRILEDDTITFYGTYDGLYTYTTVMGASKTIPSIKVEYID